MRPSARIRSGIWRAALVILLITSGRPAAGADDIVVAISGELDPLYRVDPSGTPTGFAIELMEEIAAKAGLRVRYRVYDTWGAIVAALERHQADVVPLLTITTDRQKRVLFTRPIEKWRFSIFVRSDEQTLTSAEDLAGRRVGVLAGSGGQATVAKNRPDAVIVPYPGIEQALLALLSKETDAVVVGEPAMWSVSIRASLAHRIKTIGSPLAVGNMALAVRPDAPELRDQLDALAAVFLGSPDYERLFTKWHTSPPPYWTTRRVGSTIGLGIALLIAVFLVAVWLQQQRANRRLDQSIRRLSALLNNIPDLAWLRDHYGRITAVNEAFAAACGLPAADIVGREKIEVWTAGTGSQDSEVAAFALAGESRRNEFRWVDDKGRERWIDAITSPILDERRRVIGSTGIARDITERKVAEDKLRESESLLRKFIEAAPVAIAMFDRDMCYMAVSRRFVTDYKLQAAELVGRSHYDVFPAIPAEWRAIHQRCLRGAVERSDGERFVRSDGSCHWVRWEIQPWYQPAGEIGGIVLFTEDISARRQAEEALFREKERALVTLHSIGDAVVTTDALGTIDYLNPVAERLTGWSCTEAVGRSMSGVYRIVDEETREESADPVAACLREGRTTDLTGKILIDRSDRDRSIEDSASPIRKADGEILGAVLVFRDCSATKRMAQQLKHDAAHDALTGLVNRREFERRLQRAVENAQKNRTDHALCYFDLDQFKLVNDTAGHAAGDALLQRVRGLLSGKFRDRDTLARLGGDEFALLLENCGPDEAGRIAESIVTTFRDWRYVWQGRTFQVGASVGVVVITAHSLSVADVLSKADVACYTAKSRGRGRVHLYRETRSGRSKHHTELVVAATLTDALAQRRFRLFAEPIVSLATEDREGIGCYEVLVRLLGADGTLIRPSAFLPAAERYGLMPAIDRWVITDTLSMYEGSPAAEKGIGIAINLSGASLNDDELLEFVMTQFERYAVPPEKICFEITETAAVDRLEHVVRFAEALRKSGCRIAIDDFGGGVSSFRYLRMLTADYLKIDGGFVQHVVDNPIDEAVVTSINDVGHTLGFATIGEYACSPVVVERLRTIGVNYAQGEAVGLPQPLDVVLAGAVVVSVTDHHRGAALASRFGRTGAH